MSQLTLTDADQRFRSLAVDRRCLQNTFSERDLVLSFEALNYIK